MSKTLDDLKSGLAARAAADAPTDRDPTVASFLKIIDRTAEALGKCNALDEAMEAFAEGLVRGIKRRSRPQ